MNTPPPVSPAALTSHTLTLAKERTYFALVLTFPILVWVVLVVSILGLIYLAIFAIVFWLANGLMVARLPACLAGGEYRLAPGETEGATRSSCTVHGGMEDLPRQLQHRPR